ncbi:MAG: lysophospholipid acyltransferase family protein [Pseudomonadota bacterium]
MKTFINTVLLIVWILIGALTMLVAKVTRWRRLEMSFPRVFHGFVCRLFGMHVVVRGEPMSTKPTWFVANHVTYMDVFVLGKLIKGSFLAKSEVAGWPVFGKLAGLQNTLFLERRAAKAREQVAEVRQHLATRGSLIVFPEGTSTSGDYVGRFRSSLFAATEGVIIQPVSVVYTQYDGQPMTPQQRERYAWYLPDPSKPGVNNRPFLNHFLEGLGLKRSVVEVIFHKPTMIDSEATERASDARKQCAQACEDAVRHGLHSALNLPVEAAELAADT